MALLIDPKAKTITEVEFDGTLESAYAYTGCNHVAVQRLDHGYGQLILDEEGMLKADSQPFTIMGKLFVGKTLVVGTRGWTSAPKLDLGLACELVRFAP